MYRRLTVVASHDISAALAERITYCHYAAMLDSMSRGHTASRAVKAGIFSDIKELGLSGGLMQLFGSIKEAVTEIVQAFGVGISDVVAALKSKDLFALFKAIGFNIRVLLTALKALGGLVQQGLFEVIEDIAKSPAFKAMQGHAEKVDAFLNQYPILKKLAGPALAGLLFYMWMNASMLGKLEYDLDLAPVVQALLGHFTIVDLFVSEEGLKFLAMFALGFTGFSIGWLLEEENINVIIALVWTAGKEIKNGNLISKLQSKIKFQHVA